MIPIDINLNRHYRKILTNSFKDLIENSYTLRLQHELKSKMYWKSYFQIIRIEEFKYLRND